MSCFAIRRCRRFCFVRHLLNLYDNTKTSQGILIHAFSRFGRRLNAICFYLVVGHIFAHTCIYRIFFAEVKHPGAFPGGLRGARAPAARTRCWTHLRHTLRPARRPQHNSPKERHNTDVIFSHHCRYPRGPSVAHPHT